MPCYGVAASGGSLHNIGVWTVVLVHVEIGRGKCFYLIPKVAGDAERFPPLLLVATFVFDLLCIHPFRDGNGRVSRLTTTLLLQSHGFQVARYISLERIFEETKIGYYDTLETSSQGWHESAHDPMPWIRYFWCVLLRTYGEFADRVGALGRYRGAKSDFVRAAALARIAPFRLAELQRDCPGVGRELIKRVLQQLKAEGVLVVEGRGAGARWRRIERS